VTGHFRDDPTTGLRLLVSRLNQGKIVREEPMKFQLREISWNLEQFHPIEFSPETDWSNQDLVPPRCAKTFVGSSPVL